MQFLPKKEIRNRIGISATQVDRLEQSGRFPKRVKVGCRVFWLADEVADWMRARIAERTPKQE